MPAAFARLLQRHWWRPRLTPLTAALVPLAWAVGEVAARRRAKVDAEPLPVPVIVVGNVIVGGAGKTPTVIALAALLRSWGLTPGIVSRGHGRADAAALLLDATTPATAATPAAFGDEPLLMHRRTGAPVAVARARREAALRLLAAHPEVDVLIADDGLQHHALPRDIELVVFDGRGIGNGWPLPAGPLRERASAIWPTAAEAPPRFILVNGRWPAAPARALPAPHERCFEATRALGGAVALADWAVGAPATLPALRALRGRPLLAAAGIGDPERFFAMLEAEGLAIARLPLADHATFEALPWPAGTADVVLTEKDAVKLAGRPLGATRAWVVTLDFGLPPTLAHALRDALARRPFASSLS
jgi:tetraacyldisaccharide 4'-kinase